jgi:hypothetical protein
VPVEELVVPPELWRNQVRDPKAVVDGAVWLIGHMCEHIGVSDLGDLDVLDFGCGWRFTEAFLRRGVPIGHYVGVDVSRPVVDLLEANVSDPRLEYFHLDARNDRYNPTGQPLSEMTIPELEGRQFDLICLFSVFTHLAPSDYAAMLTLLRPLVKPNGRLFYTLFIDEKTDGGHGYTDRIGTPSTDVEGNEPPDFRDVDPSKPLLVAMYSRRHAIELIDGTGWDLVSVSPPDVHLQHHIVCSPNG